MADNTKKMTDKIFMVVFGLALLPVAVESVVTFAAAYPEWATLIGLVTIALIFGLVRSSTK